MNALISPSSNHLRGIFLAPEDDRESAALIALPAGSYNAVVSGVGDTTRVGLVEIYRLK